MMATMNTPIDREGAGKIGETETFSSLLGGETIKTRIKHDSGY